MNCASCSVTLRSKKLTHFLILSYILPSLIKFRPSPKLAITISDSFVVSVLTLIPTQLAPRIATSIVHSKLDYCNYLYYKLPKSQITRLQQIQNSLARVVVKTPKCCHITHILHSLHWLKITERIEYNLLSLTYKVLTTTHPPYLHNLISVQPLATLVPHITLPSLDHQHHPRYA